MDCQGAEKQRFSEHEWSRTEGDVREVVGDTIALPRWWAGGVLTLLGTIFSYHIPDIASNVVAWKEML